MTVAERAAYLRAIPNVMAAACCFVAGVAQVFAAFGVIE